MHLGYLHVSLSKSQNRDRTRSTGDRADPDRYELLDELGQGGMSVVFRARDKQLDRDVALKVLHDFLARQEDARKRFHREAVAVARLRHPGIVEIYDYSGPEAEDAFIVCEIIDGHTLREFVDIHGAPEHPEMGALVILELVQALRHAHEQGIVHRDIKPENVMITSQGQLKLMDFGIAQIMEGATKLTATGTLLGSPAHMAPEVIDGKPSDHRSDIFSVGTMLFWMCTGQLPFAAPNPSALFRLILEGTYEPPQMLNEGIGNGLARVIARALEADPEARYQDISELQADLLEELDEVGLSPADSLVKLFLKAPETFAAEWSPKLTETLVERGRQALEEGNSGRAMDRFSRVLAVAPEHPEVTHLVSQIGRKRALNRRAKRMGVLAAAACMLGALVYVEASILPFEPPELDETPIAKASPLPVVAAVINGPPAQPQPLPKVAISGPAIVAKAKPPAIVARRSIRPRVRRPKIQLRNPKPIIAAVQAAKPATLYVRIGPGWGHIRINGQLKKKFAMGESFPLTPGRYTVEVARPDGQHAPRKIEIEGQSVFEIRSDGSRRKLVENQLSFRMPGRGETVQGWIPKGREARAPSEPDRGT